MNGRGGWLRIAIGVAGSVRVSSARTSCAAAAVVETSDDRTGWGTAMVTPPDIEARILRYYHIEKWTMGTIARQLHVHYSVVSRVLAQAGLPLIGPPPRRSLIDAYLPFIRQTLEAFPTLTASRLYGMVRERGYSGRPDHFRLDRLFGAQASPAIGRVQKLKHICVCVACRANRHRLTGVTSAILRSAAHGGL